MRDRTLLGFSVGIESDLFSCGGRKLTWFLCDGRNLLGFNVWIEIDLVFVCEPTITCLRCWDRLTWFLCGWSKLTWSLYAGRKSLGFIVSIELDLVFV